MADTHLQINSDGSTEMRKTVLWPSSTAGKEEVLKSIFSQNNWDVVRLYNVSGSHWKIEVSCQQVSYKINLYISSVRDEARQNDEFKMQLGNSYPTENENGWITLILGIYAIADSEGNIVDYILSAYNSNNFDFSGNPSIRGTRTKGLQMARILGFYKTNISYIFRPEFIYYYIENQELLNKKDASCLIQKKSNSGSTCQVIYYGAPGTGKSHEVKKLTGELLENGDEQDLPNVFRTTFHPDTDYASFVGCYKPAMQPTSKEEKTLTGKDEEIVYSFVPQVFTDAYVYAYNNSDQPTYLVIEEINRGNCAQIFGDLFQLLDRKGGVSEYKIKADKDLAQYLRDKLGADSEGIKEGKLRLPANLHILATMNTSDQSLFPMDSAFKRRWDWEYVPINYDENIESGKFEITIGKETDERKYSWVEFIKQVNEKIFDLTQSEDKQMGNFFIKQSIDEKGFKSKVMFYLWYEVLRDETENNKYFFYKKTTVEVKEELSKFTFKDLFGDKATETLQQFMEYLEVAPNENTH